MLSSVQCFIIPLEYCVLTQLLFSLCYCVFNLHFTRATTHFQLSLPWVGSFGDWGPGLGEWWKRVTEQVRTLWEKDTSWWARGNTELVWCQGFSCLWLWNLLNHRQMLKSRTLFTSPQRNVSGFNTAHVTTNIIHLVMCNIMFLTSDCYEWLRSHFKKRNASWAVNMWMPLATTSCTFM